MAMGRFEVSTKKFLGGITVGEYLRIVVVETILRYYSRVGCVFEVVGGSYRAKIDREGELYAAKYS